MKVFLRYFRPEDADFVKNIFRTIANIPLDAVITGQTLVSVLTTPNTELNPRFRQATLSISDSLLPPDRQGCTGRINAFMFEDDSHGNANIYLCDPYFGWPSIEDIADPPQTPWARDNQGRPLPGYSCDNLGDYDSDWMKTTGSTILHEFIHWSWFFVYVPNWYIFIRGGTIDDYRGPNPKHGYGPYRARQIKDIYGSLTQPYPETLNNDDNYVYYALSKYWSWRCGKQFGATPSSRDARRRKSSGFRPPY
ncbi:uncharacterized protein A1O5_06676 [Cladophialophora psammophila CBS 110553]|uniref:Lysine-specific metallo-endopeptidase domain-containing protein n=1 Tax=Cladophialophora psammophila CBS 110553 TaxID=1182543 RepID=W9X0Z6_9EURO|nr:uncharacterized protein A1O5_06676 [Cladophialophora psammophila CBS 110553]EXJ70606.1 hypothetical protein A1O5_06676 [Cladophialophora psammophila CBS 110553]